MDYPEPPEGGTVLSPYHVCDLTALICLATIVADSSFPALQRLARLGLIQVSDDIIEKMGSWTLMSSEV